MEKNLRSYFPDRNILTAKKSIDEQGMVNLILNDINPYGVLSPMDLNKGIKELWKQDTIDALEVQYLRDKSTTKETMHENYTFKRQYPEEYQKAIRAPLLKAIFKFLTKDKSYSSHFVIEPIFGKITFPTFPKDRECNQNVIKKIIEFN
jgi:hypothetical protein